MSDRYVTYVRTPEGVQADFHFPNLAPLHIDQAALPQSERVSPCKHFLAAAAECCFCGTLAGAILARKGSYTSITAESEIVVTKNAQNLDRITGLVLHVTVRAPESQREVVQTCVEHMKKGCFITQSLEAAIKSEYLVDMIFE